MRPSATGITGLRRAVFSEAQRPNESLANEYTEHSMAKLQPASRPTWTAVKAELTRFDRPGLLALIQDLYAAHKDNQDFLHARFGLGEDVLKPYKETLDRWLWPDVLRNQDTSVVKAKQAIASYKKARRRPRRSRGTDGVLLRARCRILQRRRISG